MFFGPRCRIATMHAGCLMAASETLYLLANVGQDVWVAESL